VSVAVVGAVIDVYTTKIPNRLTFPAAAAGIALNFAFSGLTGALNALYGWFAGVLCMLLPDPKHKMGFGDAKLMGAMGAFLGWKLVIIAWGYFAVLFGIIAMFRAMGAFPWAAVPAMFQAATLGVRAKLDMYAWQRLHDAMRTPIALGPLIAMGTALAIVLEHPTLRFLGFA
jgi:prepilin peptidase CpaA